MPSNYYQDILYPLQDRVLQLLSDPDLPFYLTGGTALNRFYCHHRYSDDLDLFTCQEIEDFRKIAHHVIQRIEQNGYRVTTETVSNHFCRMFVRENDGALKIDLINDQVYHHGDTVSFPLYPRVDNVVNILSNKITALSRHEAKDIVDIWTIARTTEFSWRDIMEIALKKSPVDPPDAAQTLTTMPLAELSTIKWTSSIDTAKVFKDIRFIARDILLGTPNSLFP